MLERSMSYQIEHERSKISGDLPVIHNFIKSTVSTKSNEKTSEIADDIESKFINKIESSYDKDSSISIDKTFNSPLPILNDNSKNFTAKNHSEIFEKNPSLRFSESTDLREDDPSWEDDIPERIYEVRKDSALYIDEPNIEGSTLRDSLLAVGVESRSVKTLGSCNTRENIEEAGNCRLSGRRARRESSGYFSNLGTFDEDRWITSTTELGNQQDPTTTRDICRERRRSSTKNRLPVIHNHQQQSIQATIGLSPCGQQSTKIPNLVCPMSDIDETSQFSLASDCTSITKMSRVEMPNIEEQTSLELEKPTNLEPIDNNEINIYPEDLDDHLTDKISQLSFENSTTRIDDISTNIFKNNDEKIIDISVENDCKQSVNLMNKVSNKNDSTSESSPKTSSRQKRRVIVHQCSSPNITNAELERIIEKPYSETGSKMDPEFCPQIEQNLKLEYSEIEETIVDEDDNDEVVTARLESEVSEKAREDDANSKKLLPKSIKVYQLLSTQSEDHGDDDPKIFDRRISLQVTRQNEDETIPEVGKISVSTDQRNYVCLTDEKKLIHADSVPILKIPSSSDLANVEIKRPDGTIVRTDASQTLNTLSPTGESGLCIDERINIADKSSGSMIAGIRPIYPYCPYSPYASPQGSPRTNRRRTLRESRRVSIDSRQGALQLNQYKLLNTIGQGSYGIVKLAYNEEDETHYAMKILSKKKLMKKAGIFGRIAPGRKGISNPLAKVYREIALLKKLDHPNVVKLVEVLDDPDEDNLYLVFELVQKGEVLQIPTDKPLDEDTARRHFRDVVMGVEYLHYQRIVHRDIKPSNLLVDSEGRVKVADLGVSAELRAAGELLSGSAGTPAFAAPETTTPGAQYSGTLCDVWSMGVTLYSLVTGKVPWDGAGSIIGVQAAVRSEQLRFPERPCLSDILRDLVSRMLAKDPSKRINLTEIKEHCWLTKDGNEPLPNEADNCRLPVTVTDEEVARVVTRVPKLDTLILIKTMLKQHSFQNPFLPRRIVRTAVDVASEEAIKQQSSSGVIDLSKGSIATAETLKSKTQQFHKTGRSNSAPDSYEWQTNGRQISSESLLPPVTESSSQEAEIEKR